MSVINRNLNNITFPTSLHDLAATKQKFHDRVAGIPNAIGAVDGTLIPIQAPSENLLHMPLLHPRTYCSCIRQNINTQWTNAIAAI
ncbi:hypothetical protein DPMN_194037 [Dreissena polymorpha]|uniref:Uncharacterized protein n=1 Tax=Dreissena polymorpha TaxID=45954 RepID=A0A9D3Y3T2_DREPO|nr:hypothetical protein DPMN_194037 [Dreissena polymorpha]